MSYTDAEAPICTACPGAVGLTIESRKKDLGELVVRRVLPSPARQMVGPFTFFDHMGPAEFPPGKGIAVRPHPHIGIATITYLFDGQIVHRDDLGYEQAIRPHAVNLMTTGSGMVHSERAGDDLHEHSTLHGIQSWIALPTDKEEMAPAFVHYPANDIPEFEIEGVKIRVIMGEAYGYVSPVTTYSSTLYLDCDLPEGAVFTLPQGCAELAAYVVSGQVRIDGEEYPDTLMAVAVAGKTLTLEATKASRVMVIGGDSLGERNIWWNFVSSSSERLEQAKRDWKEGRFGAVAGDDEFIPLPE